MIQFMETEAMTSLVEETIKMKFLLEMVTIKLKEDLAMMHSLEEMEMIIS